MKYNPQIHHRKSIRLRGYDYSQAGAYFITICVKDRECLFGEINDGEMTLNDAGKMIDKWWQKIPEKFPDIELHEYVVMPNHFHAIVVNTGSGNPSIVGANPRVRPNPDDEFNHNVKPNDDIKPNNNVNSNSPILGEHVGSISGERTNSILGEHVGSPLHRIVQWFKTMSTNEYIRNVKSNNWKRFNGKLWQRDYYEHIIRNDLSCQRIADYIINNPKKWKEDRFHKK